MIPPTLTRNAGVFVLTWPEMQLRFRVDKLTERSGAILGEWLIETTNPNEPSGHLMLDRINLTNSEARERTAKILSKRLDLPNWSEIIETCCVLILRSYRTGEPIIDLSKMPPITRPGFLVEPFILNKDIAMLFGDGDSGKSLFALYLGLLAALGLPDASTKLSADRPVNVLYLDFERSYEEAMFRLTQLARGMGRPVPSLFYRRCQRRMADEVEEVQRAIADQGIGLCIVDSVGAACGGEIQYAEPVFSYFQALRSLQTSILHVHHITKMDRSSDSPQPRTPYGSIYLRNYSTSTWEYRRSDTDDGGFIAGLWHDKHNTTRKMAPRAYAVTFNEVEERIRFAAKEISDVPEFGAKMNLADQIAKLLDEGPLSAKAIAEALHVIPSTVRVALDREAARQTGPRFGRDESGKLIQLLAQADVEV